MSHAWALVAASDQGELHNIMAKFTDQCPAEFLEFEPESSPSEMEKEYRETVFDDDFAKQYHPDWYGKRATEIWQDVDAFAEEVHGYIRDPDDPNGDFGAMRNPYWRTDGYSVGGRSSGWLVGRPADLRLENMTTCPRCQGTRVDPGIPDRLCHYCDGYGRAVSFENRITRLFEARPDDHWSVKEFLALGIRENRRREAVLRWDTWSRLAARYVKEDEIPHTPAKRVEEINGLLAQETAFISGYLEEQGVNDLLGFSPAGMSREQYIQAAYDEFPTYSFVEPDGTWHDEEYWDGDEGEQPTSLWGLVEKLPEDEHLWFIDYHY